MVLVLYCVWLLLLFFWYSLLCVDVVAANGWWSMDVVVVCGWCG
jgi:hypothetical protein